MRGQVVKLDRKFPMVALEDGQQVRAKHSADVMKNAKMRAVVGDYVELYWPDAQDLPLITKIEERTTVLTRKDPSERTVAQVLAANFQQVLVVHPLNQLNIARLQRELVLAFETGAKVGVILTKSDLAQNAETIAQARTAVENQLGASAELLVMNDKDQQSINAVRELIEPGTTTVLIGRSGVGKSSLVNLLVGENIQATSAVREGDGKGRHTTVNREIVEIPGGGRVVDMPGVRGLGMWEADAGIEAAFSEIEELAMHCKFGDCKHEGEPGCAVAAAVETGEITQERLDAYIKLKSETAEVRRRKEQSTWKNGKISAVNAFKSKHRR